LSRFRGFSVLAALVAIVLVAAPSVFARGGDDGDRGRRLSADPWIYVGKANDCGDAYPAGSRIVTSAWLGGMGLPDNGGDTAINGADNTRRDPHLGLLLNKNGPTPDCSSAGATINGVKGMTVDATFALGFDYRNGTHCGAGAPRFNVTARPAPAATPEYFSFVGGCSNSVPTPAPQDPLEWTRVRAGVTLTGQAFLPIPVGYRIESIDIVYDEGTDTPTVSDPMGVGLAVIDNIYVNGQFIRSGSGIEPGGGGRDDDDHGSRGHHGGHDD
jgi:hypothetical protein